MWIGQIPDFLVGHFDYWKCYESNPEKDTEFYRHKIFHSIATFHTKMFLKNVSVHQIGLH